MKKEIEDAFQALITLPLRKSKPFSLEEVWNEPMITLTKELLDIISNNGLLTDWGFEDVSLEKLIGTKCYAQLDTHGIDEKELREIYSNGNREKRRRIEFYFYSDDFTDAAHDIGWYLRDEGEYETAPFEVRWTVAIEMRVYLENGGDLARLVRETTAIYNNEMD